MDDVDFHSVETFCNFRDKFFGENSKADQFFSKFELPLFPERIQIDNVPSMFVNVEIIIFMIIIIIIVYLLSYYYYI